MPCHEVNEQSVICTSWQELPVFRENCVTKYICRQICVLRVRHGVRCACSCFVRDHVITILWTYDLFKGFCGGA